MTKTLYIIDGHAQIYRAFYAPFANLTSPAGEPTRATHVFCQMIINLIKNRKPDYLCMVMDVSDETVFRRDIDPQYKAQRDAAPEGLHVQADRIVQIVEAMGIPVFQKPGFEADDLAATMVERLSGNPDLHLYLVSKDKDLEQLLSDQCSLYDPGRDEVIGAAELQEKKGYPPELAVEVQTLTGDPTDNVPGVVGVGPKTAARLITKYGSAAAVVEHADELSPKQRERVSAFAPQLPISRQLVTLRRDVPFEFDLNDCAWCRLDTSAVLPILDELGMVRIREAMAVLGGAPDGTPAAAPSPGLFDQQSDARRDAADYVQLDTPAALETLIAQLAGRKRFALDTEATGLNPMSADLVGISVAWQAGTAFYIPIRSMTGSSLPVSLVRERLGPILADPAIEKVGHNIKYDLLILREAGLPLAGPMFDTMIASFLLDPLAPSQGLDALALAMLGHRMIPITDLIGKGKNQITIDQADPNHLCEYAAEDADFTWRLYEALAPRIEGSHAEKLFRDTEMPLVQVLAEMEHNGIAIDAAMLKRLSSQMADRMVDLKKRICKIVGHDFNVDSPRQLSTVLFDELGLPVGKKTKTGRSTDAATLEVLSRETGHEIPKLVLEYRELAKLKGTYLDTLPKMVSPRTGRIHAHFSMTSAVTGRLASSEPNLQNIPIRTETGREIRRAFVPGQPANVLLTADYSQIELRLLAHFCKDPTLVEAFRQGDDIHRAVAAQINGVALDEVTPQQRSAAKAVNFGIVYGQSAFGLSQAIGISRTDAQAFIHAYFEKYPGIKGFIDQCINDAKSNGNAETILGRRRPIPELHSRNRQQVGFGERIAVNTVVQGSAADLIKRAMIDIQQEIDRGDLAAQMLVQVHDELVFETAASTVEAQSAIIRQKMIHAIELEVPVVVDIAWGPSWYEGK